jgi:CHAT domain-containing protein
MRGRKAATFLLVAAAVANGCGFDRESDALLLKERVTEGIFWRSEWSSCLPADTTRLIAVAECGISLNPDSRGFAQLSRRSRSAEADLRRDSTTAHLRTNALVNAQWHKVTPASLDRAEKLLERATDMDPKDATLWNDRAVIQLEIARRDQNLDALLEAAEFIERAVELNADLFEATFNRGLILERLFLWSQASKAWSAFIKARPAPSWRREANDRFVRLQARLSALQWPKATAIEDTTRKIIEGVQLESLAHQYPDAARDYVFTVSLKDWAEAEGSADSVRAERALAIANRIVSALRVANADQSVAHVVEHIGVGRRTGSAKAELVSGHLRYARGFREYSNGSYDRAAIILDSADQELGSAGSPLRRWARYYRAAAQANVHHYDVADSVFRSITDSVLMDEPGLRGKAKWSLGVTQIRRGNPEAAIPHYRAAVPHIAIAKEPENLGALSMLLTEAYNGIGLNSALRAEALTALDKLAPFRKSLFLSGHLTSIASYARRRGFDRAAAIVMSEVQDVAAGLNNNGAMARALRARADDFMRLGRYTEAEAAIDSARRVVARMPAGVARERTAADVDLVYAQFLIRRDPSRALSILTEAVGTFNQLNVGAQQIRAEYYAARAARSIGDIAAAKGFLKLALAHIDERGGEYVGLESQIALHEVTERVFDELLGIQIVEGKIADAFQTLELSRAVQAGTFNQITTALPAGLVVLDYAVLDEKVIVFVLNNRGLRLHNIYADRRTIKRLVDRATKERSRNDAVASANRETLFQLLVAPAKAELLAATKVVVIPDRELHHLPFAFLRDVHRSRYLIETHELSTVPSLLYFRQAARRAASPQPLENVLLVGNPLIGSDLRDELPPLAGAEREVRRINRLYPSASLKVGRDVTRSSLSALLTRATVFHFAGHAVSDPERPELSFLALSPESVDAQSAWRVSEIRKLRLSNVRVAVLSACSSQNARPTRTGPLGGLADAFVEAGAASVITTLWQVDDDTAVDVAEMIHRGIAAGLTPAASLRRAQLAAINSDQPRLRAPNAWANFIYSGY